MQGHYEWRSQLCLPTSRDISVAWDFFTPCADRLVICANGVQIYTTGCVTGSGSATVTIPAGTNQVNYYVEQSCNAPVFSSSLFSVTITCP